ncbi:VOC family protein [Lentzea indica]|uniref:VOC family protein n=1 Tax=Lentzea indica TaxID=2604800 RepID=UPI001CB74077|nr:VOC family protein [Lentzea indica]
MSNAPLLEGIHHVKLPVSDLEKSLAWYRDHLGYQEVMHFVEEGVLMGIALAHPNGGPGFAIRLNPEVAAGARGFDFFAIGVPGEAAINALAAHLAAQGVAHNGVMRTPVGWLLSGITDPDGYDIRFYTVPLEIPEGGGLLVRES